MLTIFAGSISDLTPILTEERIPENWEPRVRSRFGFTIAKFNKTVLRVEKGVNTKKIESDAEGGVKTPSGDPTPTGAADGVA